MKTTDYIDLENQYGAQNYKPLDVVLNRGEGVSFVMLFMQPWGKKRQGHVGPAHAL